MKKILSYLLLVMAIGMAATVAYVSVSGLLKVFAGAGVVGLILFSSIEAAKIVATSAIHTYRKKIGWFYNSILSLFIVIAMIITSMGIYGFLSSSYKETFSKFENLEAQIELLEKKRDGYEKQLNIVNNEKESVTQTITELTKGLSNNVIQYKDRETGQIITTTSSSTRRVLQGQLDKQIERQEKLNTKSDDLTDKVFELDNEITEVKLGDDVAAELGPLKYLADVTNRSMDEVMKYFIILLIIIGDPMAVVMIIVFSKVVKKDDDELTNAKNTTVDPNKGITPEMRKAIVREEIKSREDDSKEKEDDTDEWDESHALDMVLNDMVEDLEEEDYDVDVEVEHNDELTEPTKESKVYIKSIEKGVTTPKELDDKKGPISREDIKEIKEKENGLIAPTIKKYNDAVNRIGSNKEVRNGDTNKLYFKKRKDDKS
mgnify:CR=1 FL=1